MGLLYGLLLAPAFAVADALTVQTTSGPVRGFSADGVREFRAIPYAASTAGDKRWTPPVPPAPWSSPRDATQYQHGCPQVVRFDTTEASDNEDCLHLNIAIPESAPAGTPVLVWIHGGAWVGGSNDIYRIDHLARETGLVVAAINYRLGALGFMPHPAFDADANGALGFEDQRLALRWVQQNIAAFGGDPGNVTLAGESAGAASVCLQLANPERAADLFHRGIIQSAGCTTPMRTVEQGEDAGLAFARELGCGEPATALACLRKTPISRILEVQTALSARMPQAFWPSVGSGALPRDGNTALQTGKVLRMPLLNGGTRDEMRLYVGYEAVAGAKVTPENYLDALSARYGGNAAAIAQRYPLSAYSSAPTALGTAMSDFLPYAGITNCQFLHTGRLASGLMPVYQYEFSDRAAPPVMPDPGFELGAVHSAELPYFFPGFTNKRVFDGPPLAEQSQRLAAQMLAWWGAFARTGAPAVPGLPAWGQFRGEDVVMRLDTPAPYIFDAGQERQCDFWRSLYPEMLGDLSR
jgi:para-nitrobenzyl esterase